MMETRFPELQELRIGVPDEVRDRQWGVIAQAIAAPDVRRVPLRRRVTLWVAAAFTVGLPVAAVAAESSVPGDLLYPVKLAVEPVRSLFDPDVVAVHRVEELERVVESDAPAGDVDDALERAELAVDRVDSPTLEQRVAQVRESIDERQVDTETEALPSDGPAGARDRAGVSEPPATSDQPSDPEPQSSDPERGRGGSDSSPVTTQHGGTGSDGADSQPDPGDGDGGDGRGSRDGGGDAP